MPTEKENATMGSGGDEGVLGETSKVDTSKLLQFVQLRANALQVKVLQKGDTKPIAAVNPTRGIAVQRSVDSVADLPAIFAEFKNNDCLTTGIFRNPLTYTVTKYGKSTNDPFSLNNADGRAYARCKEDMFYPDAGLFVFDIDLVTNSAVSVLGVVQKLRRLHPVLNHVRLHARPSSSSYLGTNGLRGVHAYFGWTGKGGRVVNQLAELFEAEEWLAREGWIKISTSGSRLYRAYSDFSVYQPNRVCFEALAVDENEDADQAAARRAMFHGITLDPVQFDAIAPDGVLDAIAYLNGVTKRKADAIDMKGARTLREEAYKAAAAEARDVRWKWAIARYGEENAEAMLSEYDRIDHVLTEAVILTLVDGGKQVLIRVGDILKNPTRYAGMTFCDPQDDGYQSAILYVAADGVVTLYDNHNGVSYTLTYSTDQTFVLEYNPDDSEQSAKEFGRMLNVLHPAQELYLYNGQLINDAPGLTKPFVVSDIAGLRSLLKGRISMMKQVKNDDGDYECKKVTVSDFVLRALHSPLVGKEKLPVVKRFAVGPVLTSDGEVWTTPGVRDHVLQHKTWKLKAGDTPHLEWFRDVFFKGWVFADDNGLSRAVAAWLTALAAPSLPIVPAILVSATDYASGKSALVELMWRALTGDERVSPLGGASLLDDEEFRKQLPGLCGRETPFLFFDNIATGAMVEKNQTLMSLITSSSARVRLLGTNTSAVVTPGRALFMTGNNIALGAEMASRTLCIGLRRPDGVGEDLIARARCHGHEAISRGMAMLAAGFKAPPIGEEQTRFTVWEHLVRSALEVGGFCSDMSCFQRAVEESPETEGKARALAALYEVSEGKPFRLRDMVGIEWQDTISRHLGVTRVNDASLGRALGRLLGSAGGYELSKHREYSRFSYVVVKSLTT